MLKRTKFSIWYYIIVVAALLGLQAVIFSTNIVSEISYRDFRDAIANDGIQTVVITPDRIYGKFKDPLNKSGEDYSESEFSLAKGSTPWRIKRAEYEREAQLQFQLIPLADDKLIADLQAKGIDYRGKIDSNFLTELVFNWIVPFGLIFLMWGFIFKKMGGGSQVLKIGKNKAKIYAEDPDNKTTFDDVAGIDEAVEEIREVVDFLQNPDKFTRLGARLPKGILLVGPPGTGKTLLAKAVAGEAEVPFFSLSGSDFVEMFVGVGAARVRDLFADAKTKSPCIIFIDEMDAIGKSRSSGNYAGGHDERENTLNQLLVEMDGFAPGSGVIIVGATNRPDVLDSALLRPGRFDRQVLVDRPDLKGRCDILAVHAKLLELDTDVNLKKIAAQTPGFAGAELANACNEAALLASRDNKDSISMHHFQNAIERVIAGLEKKNKLINSKERKIVAVHESGHAIVGHFTDGADPIQKVSIVPRGLGALGYTLQTPLEDRYLMSKDELLGRIKGLLGGRAAEDVIFGQISTGASNDLEKVAQIAREMVTIYGMSDRIPNLSLSEGGNGPFVRTGGSTGRRSEKIEQVIDEEILAIINSCYDAAKEILQKNIDKLKHMAKSLLEKEVLIDDDIIDILGPRTEILDHLKNANHGIDV